jgi:hypothetical protein
MNPDTTNEIAPTKTTMNPNEINKRIAIACGWKPHPNGIDWYEGELNIWKSPKKLPNYHGDLNAMHEAEKEIAAIIYDYITTLYRVVKDRTGSATEVSVLCATAAQRAEAFLRTIGQWEDEQ